MLLLRLPISAHIPRTSLTRSGASVLLPAGVHHSVVQAVHPKVGWSADRSEILLGERVLNARKLAIWLVDHPPTKPCEIIDWPIRWNWFTLALIWPFDAPKHTGLYPAYLSRYYGRLWASRSPGEYSLRTERPREEPVHEITHSPQSHRLIICDRASQSRKVCSDSNVIKQQRYVSICYRYEDIVAQCVDETTRHSLHETFITKVEVVAASLNECESAYWIDLMLVDKTNSPEETNEDVYRVADSYHGAQFTLIMFYSLAGVTDEEA